MKRNLPTTRVVPLCCPIRVRLAGSSGVNAADREYRKIEPLLRGPAAHLRARVCAVVKLYGLEADAQAQLEAEGVVFELALDGGVVHLGGLDSVTAPKDVLVRLASRTSVRVSRGLPFAPSTYRTGNKDVRSGAQVRGLAKNLLRRSVSQTDLCRRGD